MRPLALLLFVTAATAQNPATVPGVKPAQDEYAAAVAKAKAEYEAAVKKATADHREKLKAVQAEQTKANNLDGALAVRELLKELDEAEPPSPVKGKELVARDQFATAVSKVVWDPGRNGWAQKFQFAADGYLLFSGKKSQTPWVAIAPGKVMILGGTGVVEVCTVDLPKGTIQVRTVGSTKTPAAAWDAAVTK